MVAMASNIHAKVLPKQAEFINSTEKEVMTSGAFGSGKSRSLCYKIVKHASLPGNPVGLCRKTRASLVRTTLRTLLLPDGDLPPVLPPGSYTHQKSESIIHVKGGGDILYFGCDTPEVIGSMNLGACGVDEVTELDEDEYVMLLGRIRAKTDPYRPLFSATNPGAPSHFLFNRFFKEKNKKRKVILSKTLDNVFLPPDYVETLLELTGVHYERYVLGKWVAFEGLVYDIFDRDIHHRKLERTHWKRILVGVDEGYTNPAVLLKIGEDPDGRLHGLGLFYASKILQPEIVSQAVKMSGDVYIADPSAAGLIAAMKARGLHVVAGDNTVWDGIRGVQKRLSVATDGLPRYSFDPSLSEHTLEFESYMWSSKQPDKPLPQLDHSMDALRYVIRYVDNSEITPTGPSSYSHEEAIDEIEDEIERYSRIASTDAAWNKV